MNKIFKLILCLLLPLLVGAIGGVATAANVKGWFLTLQKPFFNPPNYLFGPVWTVLYILMGISLYLIVQSANSSFKKRALIIFGIQLFLNFWWSFIFFQFHLLGVALLEIICMWLCIIATIVSFSKVDKRAAYLQVPYLLWVSFATTLNAAIWYLN
ncbi:MAG TPA: TspO/MBR family protein [Bacteroidia bacterium]|nr:TspO/MBR family protein [Bacteroidia bacterium]